MVVSIRCGADVRTPAVMPIRVTVHPDAIQPLKDLGEYGIEAVNMPAPLDGEGSASSRRSMESDHAGVN